MIEFSASWAYPEFDEGGIPVDNTQIRRYLEWLVTEGYARKVARAPTPKYQLTRTGIIELVSSVTGRRYYYNREEFFYLYLILNAYRERVMRMIEQEGRRFPYALKLEFESLLNTKTLVENQLAYTKREIMKLDKRIEEQRLTAEYVKQATATNTPYERLIKDVEKRFPYSLNSALSVSQFLSVLTPKQALWELMIGSGKRCEHVWRPAKETLELHRMQLERLLSLENSKSSET